MTTNLNSDTLLERLRERIAEESDHHTLCGNCRAQLTAADREAGECTQCSATVGIDDESVEEHLHEDDGGTTRTACLTSWSNH